MFPRHRVHRSLVKGHFTVPSRSKELSLFEARSRLDELGPQQAYITAGSPPQSAPNEYFFSLCQLSAYSTRFPALSFAATARCPSALKEGTSC